MNTADITRRQEEALMAYNRVPQSEAAPWLQAAMSAQIALQLAALNEKLDTQALQDIATTLDAIQRHGLSVEKIS
jgi:hypothetical protein